MAPEPLLFRKAAQNLARRSDPLHVTGALRLAVVWAARDDSGHVRAV